MGRKDLPGRKAHVSLGKATADSMALRLACWEGTEGRERRGKFLRYLTSRRC